MMKLVSLVTSSNGNDILLHNACDFHLIESYIITEYICIK